MNEQQAEQLMLDLANIQLQLTDITDWLSQVYTGLYWVITILFPLVAFCMLVWWVLKRYMY